MDLKTLDVKAHLQKCPSPAGCFTGYPKGTEGCLNWVSGDSLKDSIAGQKKKCVWCLTGSWASQRIWNVTSVSHKGKLQQEGFQPRSINISSCTESRKNTRNADFENEIWSAHGQFCTSCSVYTEEGQYLLFSGTYELATNTYLHEAQHYQGFLKVG